MTFFFFWKIDTDIGKLVYLYIKTAMLPKQPDFGKQYLEIEISYSIKNNNFYCFITDAAKIYFFGFLQEFKEF